MATANGEKPDYITVKDLPTPTPTLTVGPTPPPAHTVPVVTAEVAGNTIVMHWEQIDDADLLGYKVVASTTNPHPAYPGDGYISWITERTVTTATLDSRNLVPGTTYYLSVTAPVQPLRPGGRERGPADLPGQYDPNPRLPTAVPPPVANFSANPLSGDAPLTVQLTDESSGIITSWSWDTNDDGTPDCTTQDCRYTYNDPGTYAVNLTVSNDGGSGTLIRTRYITVTAPSVPAPVAQFSAKPVSGTRPLTVEFSDESTGDNHRLFLGLHQ